MKRILVIGSGGAGKSTVARRLNAATGIELIHLDQHYWQPNWVEPEKADWNLVVAKLIAKDAWIMDGLYGSSLEMRLSRCDTVLFLDLPRTTGLWRVFKRTLKFWGTHRPDMKEGCNEKLEFGFLKWIWNFPKKDKLRVEKMLETHGTKASIIRLQSANDIKSFFVKLGNSEVSSSINERT